MKTNDIQVTQADYNKLQSLIDDSSSLRYEEKSYREALSRELMKAQIKSSDEIANDVITLHSRARITDLETMEILEFTIVLPDEADVEAGCISILAPLGTALLGYSKGDMFEWNVPAGKSRFRVDEILYQPESAGKAE
ncbi:MAG: GreA/GreB family elongation factor [Chthoniobacterales bacterium]